MAAIVAAVLAVNYLGYGKWDRHLVLTSFTTMVLLGVVATARHPTSRVTWMTTAVCSSSFTGLPPPSPAASRFSRLCSFSSCSWFASSSGEIG